MMHPDNVKFRPRTIEDYDPVRNAVAQFVEQMNGNQPGDPMKAVNVMIDVVKGEGVAEGRTVPERLPIGSDCLEVMRKKRMNDLLTCNEWEGVIRSTYLDE